MLPSRSSFFGIYLFFAITFIFCSSRPYPSFCFSLLVPRNLSLLPIFLFPPVSVTFYRVFLFLFVFEAPLFSFKKSTSEDILASKRSPSARNGEAR
jgi:hypothetical protein